MSLFWTAFLYHWCFLQLIIVVSPTTTTATATESSTSKDPECDYNVNRTMPGAWQLVTGVDLAKVDLRTDGYVDLKPRLFTMSCSEGRKLVVVVGGPNLTDDIDVSTRYDVPDQVKQMVARQPSLDWVSMQAMQTTFDYRRYTQRSIKVQGSGDSDSVSVGSFSASPGYVQMLKDILRTTTIHHVTEASFTTVRAVMQPPEVLNRSLNPDFVGAIEALRSHDSSSSGYYTRSKAYKALIDSYGTHYWASARFGGILVQRSGLAPQSYVDRFNGSSMAVLQHLGRHFVRHYLNNTGGDSYSASADDGLSTEFRYYGGIGQLPVPGSHFVFSDWLQSLQPNHNNGSSKWPYWMPSWLPSLVGGVLRPISELISDPKIASEFDLAVRVHLVQSQLEVIRAFLVVVGTAADKGIASEDEVEEKMRQLSSATSPGSLDSVAQWAVNITNRIDIQALHRQNYMLALALNTKIQQLGYYMSDSAVSAMNALTARETDAMAEKDLPKMRLVVDDFLRFGWALVACATTGDKTTAYQDPFYYGFC